jgi:hypothetical protein
LKEHQTAATVGGYGAVGLATATAIGVAGSAAGWLYRKTGARALWRAAHGMMTPAEGAAEGVGEGLLAGSGEGVGVGGMTVAGVALPLLAGAAVLGGAYLAGASGSPMFDEQGRQISGASAWPAPAQQLPGPRATDTAGPRAAPQVTVNQGGVTVTINGVGDDATFHQLVTRLTAALSSGIASALSIAAADPHGSTLSPYTQGYTP